MKNKVIGYFVMDEDQICVLDEMYPTLAAAKKAIEESDDDGEFDLENETVYIHPVLSAVG